MGCGRKFIVYGRINVFRIYGNDFWEKTIIPNELSYFDTNNCKYELQCFYNPGSEWMEFNGCFESVEKRHILLTRSKHWTLSFSVWSFDEPNFEYHENLFTFIENRELGLL